MTETTEPSQSENEGTLTEGEALIGKRWSDQDLTIGQRQEQIALALLALASTIIDSGVDFSFEISTDKMSQEQFSNVHRLFIQLMTKLGCVIFGCYINHQLMRVSRGVYP